MAKNKVKVDLDAQDNLTGSVDKLVGKIRDGVFQANFLTSILDDGFNIAQQTVGNFTGSLQAAMASQTDIIKSVGSFAETISVPYAQAEKLNADITQGLAKYASALPGSTDTYVQLFRSVSDDVAITSMELNKGVFNAKQYTQQVTDLTAKFAALGDGLSFGQITNALSGLQSGQSIPALKQLEYFQRNPVLIKRLESLLNGKDLQDLTSGERLEMTLKALDMTLTDDTIKRLGGTLDGAIQGIKTTLFDPNVGIFGLLRDLDANAQGQQSAFDAMNQATQALIGSDGLFYAVGGLFSALGFEFEDPMVQLRSAGLFFKSKIEFITTVIKRFGSYFQFSSIEAGNFLSNQVEYFISSFKLSSLGGWLSDAVNNIFQSASKLDYGPVFAVVGKLLADLIDMGADFLKGLDYGAIATTAINLLGGLVTGFGSFLANLSLDSYLSIAAIIGAVGIAAMIGAVLTSAFGLVVAAVSFAGAVLAPGFIAAVAGIPLILVGAAALAIGALAKAIIDNWDTLWGDMKAGLDQVGAVFTGLLHALQGIVMSDGEAAKQGLQEALGGVAGLFNWMNERLDGVKAQFGIQTSGQAQANQVADEAERRFQAANNSNPTQSTTVPTGRAVPNAASGFGGILGGIFNELRQMPSGAQPIIANSTEAILNQAQQRSLTARLGSSGGGGGLSVGSMTVNTAATDVEGIARDVMAAIATEYRQFQQSKLTAIG